MLSIALTTQCVGLYRAKLFSRLACSHLNLFNRRYALKSLSDTSVESKANIIRYIRSIENKGMVIPWRDLASTHNISEAALKQIVAEDTAERKKQHELSIKITEAAVSTDRYFNREKGLCNWEALATEFDLPLIDCLRAFNSAKSPHKLRSMPEPFRWTQEDRDLMLSLLQNFSQNTETLDWSLVGVYMNIEPDSCKSAAKFFKKFHMSSELFKDIHKLRKQGLTWSRIYYHYPYISSIDSLENCYRDFKRKVMSPSTLAVWSEADSQRMLDIIRKHHHDINQDEERFITFAVSEFPSLPESFVRKKFSKRISSLRASFLSFSLCNRVGQLVAEHGENWKHIDSELETFPGAAKYNWDMIKGLQLTETWSLEDTKRAYHCINTNMSVHDSVRYIGTKSPLQYQNMKHELKKQARAGSAKKMYGKNAQWSEEGKARLFELVSMWSSGSNTTWQNIANQLGHSVTECIYTYHMLQAADWRPSTVSQESKVEMVTRVCKEEYMSVGCIDWTNISKLTGLDQRECMESCDMEDYKKRWVYDADTFSWDDANRMTDFIAANYPGTSPVNYCAVSNYMWIKIGDCINMHNMLQGRFYWTDNVIHRITAMRLQGHEFSYIAKQLSPLFSASTVSSAYSRRTRVHTPISEEEKRHITELVDKYVGKFSVKEIMQKVKNDSASWSHSVTHFTSKYIQSHAYYRKRLAGMDHTNTIRCVLSEKLTSKQAAAELGITTSVLNDAVRRFKARGYSSRWTVAETEQLIAYVRSLGGEKPDWVYCEKLIGSKHSRQCYSKSILLKKKIPNICVA